MLFNNNDLTMLAEHIAINIDDDTGDPVRSEPEFIRCWTYNNVSKASQNEHSRVEYTPKKYILGTDSNVRVGDLLDGYIVNEVVVINDFDGSVLHYEVSVAIG